MDTNFNCIVMEPCKYVKEDDHIKLNRFDNMPTLLNQIEFLLYEQLN